jgi:branched-chain amino acid transport system permease protein
MSLSAYINIILNGICIGGLYGLSSSAFSFEIGALKMANFAYGSSVMVGMYCTYFLLRRALLPFPLVIAGVVIINFFIGWLIRKTVLKVTTDHNLNILCTMGLELIFINVILFIFTAKPVDLAFLETRVYFTPDISVGLIQLICLGLAALLLSGFSIFLQNTWTGRAIRAVVQNKDIANLMGIDSERMLDIAFAASYILIGVSGMMLMLLFPADPQFGNYITLIAFVICVVSGLGNLWGSFLTGVIVGVMSALISTVFGAIYHDPLFFALFVVILLARPNGLFMKKSKVITRRI